MIWSRMLCSTNISPVCHLAQGLAVQWLPETLHFPITPKTLPRLWFPPGIPASYLRQQHRAEHCRSSRGDRISHFTIHSCVPVSLGMTKCSFPTPVKSLGMHWKSITNCHSLEKKLRITIEMLWKLFKRCSKFQLLIQNPENVMLYPLCYHTRFQPLHGTLFRLFFGFVFFPLSCHKFLGWIQGFSCTCH